MGPAKAKKSMADHVMQACDDDCLYCRNRNKGAIKANKVRGISALREKGSSTRKAALKPTNQ